VVDGFCKQTVLWERRIPDSANTFGNPQYEPGTEIQVRFVRKHRTFQTKPGEIIVTERSIMTKDAVKTGDRITYEGESFVIQIGPNEVIWLDGVWLGAFCHG
jgi:hypothetical protein